MFTPKPCPTVPHPHIFWALPGMMMLPLHWETCSNAQLPFQSWFFFPNMCFKPSLVQVEAVSFPSCPRLPYTSVLQVFKPTSWSSQPGLCPPCTAPGSPWWHEAFLGVTHNLQVKVLSHRGSKAEARPGVGLWWSLWVPSNSGYSVRWGSEHDFTTFL